MKRDQSLAQSCSDKYLCYFSDIYFKAIKLFESGKKLKAIRLLEKGSKQYSKMFYRGAELNPLIEDRCSLWLCQYYTRENKSRQLNKLLERNFVLYDGDYYPFTTSDLVWRMIPIDELKPNWNFGVDAPDSEDNDKVLELIRKRRGMKK